MPYAESFSHHHHNLIRLCTDCHEKYDDGLISRQEVSAVKDRLIERIRNDVRKQTDLFARATSYHIPQPDAFFVGRTQTVKDLRDHLSTARIVVVEGVGGIGKTQLVIQALSGLNDMDTIWLDVDSYNSIADLEIALSHALLHRGLTASDQSSILTSVSGQSLRIVLDGLEHVALPEWDGVIDFLSNLITLTEKPRFVITTQVSIATLDVDAANLVLGPLAYEDFKHILEISAKRFRKSKMDNKDLDWIIQFCDGHPFALKLVRGLLNYYKDVTTVAKRLRLAGIGELKDPVRSKQKSSTSLEVCLQEAYSCLSHGQRRLLQYISNFPGGCIVPQAETWCGADAFDGDLAELRRFFLIEERYDWLDIPRLYLLTPIRVFVRKEWETNNYQEAATIQMEVANELAFQAMYLSNEYLTSDRIVWGLMRIEADLLNYTSALRYARWGVDFRKSKGADPETYLEVIAHLTSGLSSYFFTRGLLTLGASFEKAGIDACKQLGNEVDLANRYMFLSQFQIRVHDYEGVEKTTDELVSLAARTNNPGIQALASMNLGYQAEQRREPSKAAGHYQSAVEYFRNLVQGGHVESEDQHDLIYAKSMLSLAHSDLGRIFELMGRNEEALDQHLDAFRYQEEIGDPD